MAHVLRGEFDTGLVKPVVNTAKALLEATRVSSSAIYLILVGEAWECKPNVDHEAQIRTVPSRALVVALRKAHDAATETVFWPAPEQMLKFREKRKQPRSGSRERDTDRRRGNGDGDSELVALVVAALTRLGLVVSRDVVRAALAKTTGGVEAGALPDVPTAPGAVNTETSHRSLPARLRASARTAVAFLWCPTRAK